MCQLIVFFIYYCCSLFSHCHSVILIVVFDFHSFFVQLFCFIVHCSKEKDSSLTLDCIPGILIPFNHCTCCTCCTRIPSPSMIVNKHHTSDCINFVLVQDASGYYDHRHSGIDETNILQEVKAVECETITYIAFCFPTVPSVYISR